MHWFAQIVLGHETIAVLFSATLSVQGWILLQISKLKAIVAVLQTKIDLLPCHHCRTEAGQEKRLSVGLE